VHSARNNGHEPHAYLKDVLERLPTHPHSRIEELLPHCVFRSIVTARFGNVTGHFGDRDRSRISDHRDRRFRHRDRSFRPS
jgi:IS66 C-terminal element